MKTELMWARFVTRWVAGLVFFMAGWANTFQTGPTEYARTRVVEPLAGTWIPEWLLWASGTAVPVIELVGGALLCLGFFVLPACAALGVVLIALTYGHLLRDPFAGTAAQMFPRLVLLVLVLIIPRDQDRMSLDHWFFYRRNRWFQPPRKPAPSSSAEPSE